LLDGIQTQILIAYTERKIPEINSNVLVTGQYRSVMIRQAGLQLIGAFCRARWSKIASFYYPAVYLGGRI